MIRKVNKICEKLNKKLGVSIFLPNPSKNALRITSVCNLVVGTVLIITGIVIKFKWCVILGVICVASGGILLKENL